jgi:hypothetical protein
MQTGCATIKGYTSIKAMGPDGTFHAQYLCYLDSFLRRKYRPRYYYSDFASERGQKSSCERKQKIAALCHLYLGKFVSQDLEPHIASSD